MHRPASPPPSAPNVPDPGRLAAFLERAGWAGAGVVPLAGDASARAYDRLHLGGGTAVLMRAPPGQPQEIDRFARLAAHLRALGLSAPRVLASDPPAGLMLLEDLGDALFARLPDHAPEQTRAAYAAAVDLLVVLHRAPPPPGLPAYDPAEMAARSALAAQWYLPALTGTAPEEAAAAGVQLETAVRAMLDRLASGTDVLVLRDMHAENLLWLPDRCGVARVGLLDFQDAMAGHRAYDLMSLLCDARRDLPGPLVAEMQARYVAATGQPADAFGAACAAVTAQRALRILGVFARLALRDGKPRYLVHLPRVWAQLQAALTHPDLADLAQVARALLPPPTPAALRRLHDA